MLRERSVRAHPAVQAGMIDLNAALCHHLFELPIADWIGHIPSDAPQDDTTLELAAYEIDHGRRTGRLLPVSLRALGKVSKFATEPLKVIAGCAKLPGI